MRRRKLLVALGGLAVLVAVGVAVLAVLVWPQSTPRITRANCLRIKEGMSREEIEEILGPPGDYRNGRGATQAVPDPEPFYRASGSPWQALTVFQGGSQEAEWYSDSLCICVALDFDGRVRDARALDRRMTEGFIDNLFWRAKRQWRRIWTGAPF
jgi:hypothetical protein